MTDQERQQHIDDSRVRIYYVRNRDILRAFSGELNNPSSLYVMNQSAWFKALPPGYTIRSVHHDFCRNAFAFVIHHPSFDPVPDAQEIPRVDGVQTFECFVLHRQADCSYALSTRALDD